MWPFASRGARASTVAPAGPATGAAPVPYAAYATNDVAVKVWLPERIVAALDVVSAESDTSRPDVVRALVFEHIHGRAELCRLQQWFRSQPVVEPEIKASEKRTSVDRGAGVRMLGKSVEDFKLWMPAAMKADLASLAAQEGLGLSDCIRKILVLRLLGDAFHRKWQAAIGRVPAEYREMEGQP